MNQMAINEECIRRIRNISPEVLLFIDDWYSDRDYIVAHTSGSTGSPKEIQLLKHDMRQSARATNQRFEIGVHSRMLCPLSIDYIAGKMMVVRALEAGCELVLEKPSNDPLQHDYGAIDLTPVVPSQCDALLRNPLAGLVKAVIVGGAPVSPEIERRLLAAPFKAYATYGMTETCSHVALRRIGDTDFTAMPGFTFEMDSRGCLIVNSAVMSFRQIVTNDIVELVSPTAFRWVGRYDNVINSGGVKVFPEKLERILAPFISFPFFFCGEPDAKWGTKVVMVVEVGEIAVMNRSGLSEIDDNLMKICRQELPAYSVPKKIVYMRQLPRTSNGKLLRRLN